MEFDTQLLLRHTPEDAIVMMVNEVNNTKFPSGTFEFGLPEVVNGRETKIHLKVRDSSHKLDEVPYEGEFDFTYHRLDMADHFADILSGFRPTLPTSTSVLLDELKRRLRQEFFLEDIVLEDITRANAAPYRLKAKAESLRWYGYIDVMLVDLTDLQTFLSSALPGGLNRLSETRRLRDPAINYAMINATAYATALKAANPDQRITSLSDPIYLAVRNTVPPPGQSMNELVYVSPWTVMPAKQPFNLYNARVITPAAAIGDVEGDNVDNTLINRAFRLELDPNYCDNFVEGMILDLPYLDSVFSDSEFTLKPRMTQAGTVSPTDGTEWNVWLNSLPVGHVIKTLGVVGSFELIEGEVWEASPIPSKTNLYNAVVQYNGQRRPQDIPPMTEGLNRVMVVTLSEHNTVFRGNMTIHYRAPVVMTGKFEPATVGYPYLQPLEINSGVGPYTVAIVGGALAPGHYIDMDDFTVKGTTNVVGSFAVDIRVTDSRGVAVLYKYSYSSTATELIIEGDALDGEVGVPYDHVYVIKGGVPPYRTTIFSGNIGNLSLGFNTHRITGTPNDASEGLKQFRVEVLDSVNTAKYLDDQFTIHPEAIPPGPADPFWDNVVSLLPFQRGQMVDLKGKSWTPSGDAYVDRHGGLILNDTDDFIVTAPHVDFNFPGDFTVEQLVTLPVGDCVLFDLYSINLNSWQLYINNAGIPQILVQGSGPLFPTMVQQSVLNVAQLHLAWSRRSGVSRLHVGGVKVGQVNDNRNYNQGSVTQAIAAGAQVAMRNPRYDTIGVIHAQRITKGIGRYVDDTFVPPTSFETHG